ncbi:MULTISPECIES: outer membrane protein assembly factor BamE domain-containing protein [Cupriavidus]
MKNRVIVPLLIAASLAVTACGTTRTGALATADEATIAKRIINGKTTQQEVREFLGGPDDVRFTDSGQEVWQYVQENTTVNGATFIPVVGIFAGGSKTDQKLLTILFDKKGVVVRSTYATNSKEYRNTVR